MSLQSRLDIICDESDRESGPTVGAGEEGSNELSTKESFLLQNLHSLMSDVCNMHIIVPEEKISRNYSLLLTCYLSSLYQYVGVVTFCNSCYTLSWPVGLCYFSSEGGLLLFDYSPGLEKVLSQ